MDFQKGQIVVSRCGRDKGYMLAVVGNENGYVLVCDGKERPLEKAKRKNPRHLTKISTVISEELMATNPKLRKTLRALSCQGR